ncbi:type VI secretion system ATPase TssH [Taylorella equigenitalis]|uniref:type VI secretion system ATPase TssH n=1 Tax=Taylorella equigenitalis TaxID=29575 RepID=UPI0023B1E1C2|nr:type VI secretion system ATPase TssH [Taylorella equigenitalis]WEE00509.1 type VI secretion system ATPase TssH [Taylorella equigenitalis]WEE01986.1 type VI secretion system ATPase TssH [Taylorella equigenitalis]WFD78522.1 type VI secretion system ATPase TssH [Taylorella equigenitalis]WFD80000.1 type VI secretion system ATPase TssH [Taylorella equigenitalis]WFD81477.1 type VI secretion system ATPase TssH [Taylorella equigenitalis]
MSDINRTDLFGKLNTLLYRSLEGATSFCKLRGNSFVELVHWIHQILHEHDSDLQKIIRHFDLRIETVERDVVASLDELPRGASSVSDLSEHIDSATERAWVYGSLKYGDARIRSGYLILGILKTNSLRSVLYGISSEFKKITPDVLAENLIDIVKNSAEEKDSVGLGQASTGASASASPQNSGKSALAQYAVDLTAKARNKEIDPVSGRDEEIRQIVDILMRRRQNNPLLTGEAGVGKTAVVEGFALRLAKGDVPETLRDVTLYLLDIGLLQAGASMKGEFESRLRSVIDEVQSSEKPIVLFIDEIHTLVGAGGAQGTGDAANLLKPALARGQLRTIGATTWAEYKKYIEKDPALTRRFQTVQVHEPNEEKALIMLRGISEPLENHHKVLLLDEAIEAAVRLSHRYIPARQLPDKAIALLDTACARVAVSQYAEPAALEDTRRTIEYLNTEREIALREQKLGHDKSERLEEIEKELDTLEERQKELDAKWSEEKELIKKIFELRKIIQENTDLSRKKSKSIPTEPAKNPELQADSSSEEASQPTEATQAEEEPKEHVSEDSKEAPKSKKLSEKELDEVRKELRDVQQKLLEKQGEYPLIFPSVDGNAVASVVADWTGIPVGRMVKNEANSILTLADTLEKRVIGQRHGLETIVKRIQTSRAKLTDPNKPVGVFLLTGPSGVGKTETALALAESLYGGEQNLITINMSEFQEAHTVSTLKGAPPGYVGYGEGGVLTEAVRRRPYSVVLLDEVEKAHPDVHEIFFQVFDKGFMEDGEGRYIDFKNTVIILTSNVGTDRIVDLCKDPELMPDVDGLTNALREPLLKTFPAALLGRLVVVPYFPLSDEMLGNIVKLQLRRIEKRLKENHNIDFKVTDEAIKLIVSRCTQVESGGRMVDAILTNTVLPNVSHKILEGTTSGQTITSLSLDAKDGEFVYDYTKVPNK